MGTKTPHRTCILAAAAVTAALAGTALAQPPVKTKTYDFNGDALEGQMTRPDGEMISVAPARLRQFDPAASPKRIAELDKQLAGTTPDRAQRADQFLALAGLLAGQARYFRLQAVETEIAADDVKDPARRRELQATAKRHRQVQVRAQNRAIAIYLDIVCEAGDRARGADCAPRAALKAWPPMHEAVFELAFLLGTTDQRAQAVKLHARLVANHPQSRYAGDALLAMAEQAFEDRRLAEAEALYARVLRSKTTTLHGYARYKTGWVQLNLSRDADAFASFAAVIAAASKDPRATALAREARHDLVRAYANFGTAAGAFAALDRVAPGHGVELLDWLGETWLDQGKSSDAVAVLTELQRRAPGDVRVCDWQAGVVRATFMIGDQKQKVDAIDLLVATFRRVRAMKGVPADKMKSCRDQAAGITAELATVWHKEAIALRAHGADLRVHADKLYTLYLTNFPTAADAGTMRYYQAELTWVRAEAERDPKVAIPLWELAAERHTEVATGKGVSDKIRRDSAYAAVLAWKNALAIDVRSVTPTPPPDAVDAVPAPQPIPARERKMLAAFRTYISVVKDPKDDELATIKFLEARIYWRYDHADPAVRLLEAIITDHKDHEVAEYSVNLMLDILNRHRRYPAMLAWVDRLLAQPGFLAGKPELGDRLKMIKLQGARKKAEQLHQAGKHDACGKAYVEIYNADVMAGDADQVLYNAGVCFERAAAIGSAILMFRTIDQKFAKSPVAAKALARLGQLRARVGQYREAAEALERYSMQYGTEKDAAEAISLAIHYYRALGDHPRAIAATERFIKQYGRKQMARAAEAAFAVADMHEDAGQPDRAEAALLSYLRTWAAAGGIDRQVIAQVRLGRFEWNRSCKLARLVDGACVELRRPPPVRGTTPRSHCTPPTPRLVPGHRDPALVASARRRFLAAIDLHRRAAASPPGADDAERAARARAMLTHVAAAEWHLAEGEFEAFLAMAFPANLDFDPDRPAKLAQSKRRFSEFLDRKRKLMAALAASAGGSARAADGTYRRIIDGSGAGTDWAVASVLRIGQLAGSFASDLIASEIPATVRTGTFALDKVDAYCDMLTDEAAPLQSLAATAYDACTRLPTATAAGADWSAACTRELRRLRPAEAPPRELHAPATAQAPITDIEPLARPR